MFGLGATGLAIARALGRRGYSVLGVDHRPWEIGRASRYVTATQTCDVATFKEGALAAPDHLKWYPAPCADERSVGFACGDPELIALCEQASRLAPWLYLPASIRDGLAGRLVDKRAMYERCAAAGARVPEWRAGLWSRGGPWVVKPVLAGASRQRPFAEKARLVSDLGSWREQPAVIVQDFVPGSVKDVHVWAAFVDDRGQVGVSVTAQKLRERPAPFGSASWLQTTRDPEVDRKSRDLVGALGLTGTIGVEWKRCRGELWLIEVNPRPVLWLGVAEQIVVDAFQALRGAPRPPASAQPAGRTWRYAAREPLSPRADVDALWASDDPLPGLLGPAYTALLAGKRLLGKRF